MITLRQLTKSDAVAFRRVRLLGLQESPTAFGASYVQEEKMPIDEWANHLDGSGDRWVIGAFEKEDLVGVVGFVRDSSEKSRHKGFLWGMYVAPLFRGRGVGRALAEEALARIDVLPGLRKVRLSVVVSNQVALGLYESLGFVRYGQEDEALCVDGVFHSEFHMVRQMKKPVPNHELQPKAATRRG
jgi:ribosomal protein S18 acetylase RimI-like enzyme